MYLIRTSFAAPKVETKYALCGLVFPYVKSMEISTPNSGHFNCVAAQLTINQSLSLFDTFVFMPSLTF